MNRSLAALAISFAVFTSATPLSAEFRIATVDVNRILNESNEAKEAKTKLEGEANEAKKKIEAKRTVLKDLEQKVKAGKFKEDSKEVEDLRNQTRAYIRFVKDSEGQINQEFAKSNKSLTEKTVKLVEAYAKKNDINLVLDKSEKLRGPVLFRAQTFDITNEILKQVNG